MDLPGNGDELNLLTVTEASKRIAAGAITSETLVADCLARIEARNGQLGAWRFVDPEQALARARSRDASGKSSGPLHGVPVGVKDVLDTFDMPTEYGSAIYRDHRPAADSACVAALRAAGAVVLGKTTTTEFASPVPAGVRNPHDTDRTPGVSSSGSAAAVADFMAPFANGTQTGGSVILPAAFCGVVGYKASLDALDRAGIRALKPLSTRRVSSHGRSPISLSFTAPSPASGHPLPVRASASAAPPYGTRRNRAQGKLSRGPPRRLPLRTTTSRMSICRLLSTPSKERSGSFRITRARERSLASSGTAWIQ